jgi:hypothetical protein
MVSARRLPRRWFFVFSQSNQAIAGGVPYSWITNFLLRQLQFAFIAQLGGIQSGLLTAYFIKLNHPAEKPHGF